MTHLNNLKIMDIFGYLHGTYFYNRPLNHGRGINIKYYMDAFLLQHQDIIFQFDDFF